MLLWWHKLLIVLVSIIPGLSYFITIIGLNRGWKWLVDGYPYKGKM